MACCRLCQYNNSSLLFTNHNSNNLNHPSSGIRESSDSNGGKTDGKTVLSRLGSELRGRLSPLGLIIRGGVYNKNDDELWYLSLGDDVSIRYSSSVSTHLNVTILTEIKTRLDEVIYKFQNIVCPPEENDAVAPRFEIRESEVKGMGKTVFAIQDCPEGTIVDTFHGYIRSMYEGSNEHYNAPVSFADPPGSLTVDPTLDTDNVLLEFQTCLSVRVNEPPPGSYPNCKWKLRRMQAPQYWLSRDVKKGEELFMYYGEGYAPVRDYDIQTGLEYEDFGDVED